MYVVTNIRRHLLNLETCYFCNFTVQIESRTNISSINLLTPRSNDLFVFPLKRPVTTQTLFQTQVLDATIEYRYGRTSTLRRTNVESLQSY